MDDILSGFELILHFNVLAAIFCGTALGLVMGALPGLTAAMAIALLIPLSFGMPPIMGIGMLLGSFCGAVAGGAVPAILLGIPGTPASVTTTLDGFQMTRKGEAGKALGLAIGASFFGGIFGAVMLVIFAPPIAAFALEFGPAEYFSLGIFGLAIIASVSSGSLVKGVIAGLIGVVLATVGADPIVGTLRFTFGQPALITGVSILPALIGLFAVGQILEDMMSSTSSQPNSRIGQDFTEAFVPWAMLARGWKVLISSSVIGTVVGAIPGAGGSISSFLAYDQAKRMSKHPELFGTGYYEGVIASESSNNATAGGALIPMLTLGIPGEVATAVLIGGLTIQGLQPGPALFNENAPIVYGIFLAFLVANVAMFLLQQLGIRIFVRILKLPETYLVPLILVFCVLGVYGISGSIFDVWLMLGFGVLGFLLTRYGFGTAPVILGLILGPLVESNYRRSVLVYDNGPWEILTRPLSAILLTSAVLFIVIVALRNRRERLNKERSTL